MYEVHLVMHLCRAFYGTIIGAKASTKRRLEIQTRTTITVPPRTSQQTSSADGNVDATNPDDCNIVIQGESRLCVHRARKSIEAMISSCRSRIKATHFYGLPMNTEEFQQRFHEFQVNPGCSMIKTDTFYVIKQYIFIYIYIIGVCLIF